MPGENASRGWAAKTAPVSRPEGSSPRTASRSIPEAIFMSARSALPIGKPAFRTRRCPRLFAACRSWKRSDVFSNLANHLAPSLLGFLRIAAHGMSFAENTDRPALAIAVNYRQRFRFGRIKHRDRFLNVHAGMQHNVAKVRDAEETLGVLDIRSMGVSHQRQPGI